MNTDHRDTSGGHADDRIRLNPDARELEAKLAAFCGIKHAVACADIKDARLMALASCGIGPGDAILISAFGEAAFLSAIRTLGATPVFVDIEQTTFTLDPEQLEKAVTALAKRDASIHPLPAGMPAGPLVSRGIVATDLFGMPAEYEAIKKIADAHGLFLIEDAAEAFGAEYRGRPACFFGNIGLTSFSAKATLWSPQGGAICFTDQDDIADKLRAMRLEGAVKAQFRTEIADMNPLQAKAILEKFAGFPAEISRRREIAHRYTTYLDANPLLVTPYALRGVSPAWSRYCLLTESDEDRAKILEKLGKADIALQEGCGDVLPFLPESADLQYRAGDFPVSEDYATRLFPIPLHSELTAGDLEHVADILNDWE